MEYALTFAETGHLCLCTLHANNASQALDRMIHFFPGDRPCASMDGFIFEFTCNGLPSS